ncbi:MAG: ABC transporter permease [Lachnospiraceae bacterium]|nr:ABC transporter permease [Lachnospiraceae bacterium]
MKNREMRSYLSLIPISAKTRRKQNRLILLCIIFAVFLVTTVFSSAEIMVKGETEGMIRHHGSHHIVISGLSEAAAEQIAGRDDVSAAAWCNALGEGVYEGYYINDIRVILYGAEADYIDDIRAYEREGTFPRNDGEIMLNTGAKERLGVGGGDSVSVHTPTGHFTFTVAGFCADEWEMYDSKFEDVSAYVSVDAFDRICAAGRMDDNSDTGVVENGNALDTAEKSAYYVRFADGADIKGALADLKEQYGLADKDIDENLVTMGAAGASSNLAMNSLYLLAAIVFVLILIAGVLMIASCLNSTVAQRTKFFGMMRCIGASREQVMRFVRLEALNWCKTAIPAGLVISVVFTFALSMILRYKVGGEFDDFRYRFSVVGIVSGVLVGVLSVLLAAYSPARRAAGVSPVAAVSGNAESGKTVSHAANTRIFKVEYALGVYHAMAAKKNMILMSLSFAFTVVLFLVFSAGLDLFNRFMPSENDLSPDISISAADNTNSMDRGMKEEISRLPGVETAFGCAVCYEMPAEINGVPGSVDLISYDAFMFAWSEKSVASGDFDKVSGDTDYVMTIFNMDSRLNTGDTVRIGDTELTIACVCSEGIGTEKRPAIVCTEETFMRLTGERDYLLLGFNLAKNVPEETVETIRVMTGGNDFVDRREDDQTVNSSFWVFRIAAYGFLAVIALITVFNIMNNISMSVSARMKQYGAMRAVGMGATQMTRMIAAEAAAYAVCGLFFGYIAGMYLHRLFMVKIVFTHFGGSWKIPYKPLTIITIIVVLSCVAAVRAPARRIREMAITETINEL